ncbi:glycine cleavage system protein GcvH [Flavobacterium sp. Sd200]|uniref:glycine cleavage system protein GcvH n=1 Tax=Flavobacterium sp. Sd200 TaxID=2692211 RepID=UPI001371EB2C|nr:glycine cleavage system protein GcvH [Flavobacterium sp. Sd200]MXN93271.1 glycine cleavage system protein GcvH [Flavobacterium sp. Sd200]
MEFPEKLYYSKEHTWLSVDGGIGTIGITEFAQNQLGEIVYVDLPNVGQNFEDDEIFGAVEAVKTTNELFMPVGGKVIETNQVLLQQPELVNSNPFGAAWMIKIQINDGSDITSLLSYEDYKALVEQ